jgi:hypothetical protein
MKRHGIKFILVQIDEAHSTAWPLGLENTPTPQKSFDERVERANIFVKTDSPPDPFTVCIDAWDNQFAETFRSWPDKYYCIDNKLNVIAKSEYGDALIKKDCTDLIHELMEL